MKEIIMEVNDDGDISIETKGFAGNSCIAESQFLKMFWEKKPTPSLHRLLAKRLYHHQEIPSPLRIIPFLIFRININNSINQSAPR